MVCLKCGSAEPDSHSQCQQCGGFLGYPAEGRGFLPQLLHLQDDLKSGAINAEEGEDRLIRLDEALAQSIAQLDGLGAQVMAMPLDEVQSATVGGFLHPVRDGLTRLREVAANLSLDGQWSDQDWEQLKAAQSTLLQANQGVAYLYQFLGDLASQQPPA